MVNDVMVDQMLHKLDSNLTIWCFFVAYQPVNELLCYKAVWIGTQVVPAILYQFAVM